MSFHGTKRGSLKPNIFRKWIKVDKAKIEVIDKPPPPTSVKGIRSLLRHAAFYRRFIKDFSKILKPLCMLLEYERPFNFNEDCLKAFVKVKKALVTALVIIVPDWNISFELICDVSDHLVGAVLRQRKGKIFHSIYYASKTLTNAQLNYNPRKSSCWQLPLHFINLKPVRIE